MTHTRRVLTTNLIRTKVSTHSWQRYQDYLKTVLGLVNASNLILNLELKMVDAYPSVRYFFIQIFSKLRTKHEIFEELPSISIDPADKVPEDLIEKVFKVVNTHSYVTRPIWHPFLHHHYLRMTSTWNLSLQYVLFTYYTINDGIYEVNERLISLLSMAGTIELYFPCRGYRQFLPHTIDILCVFFKKEVAKNFFVGGGWKTLDEFISKHGYLEKYGEIYKPMPKHVAERTNGQMFGMLAKFLKNFDYKSTEVDEIENHERAQLMVKQILELP